MRPAYLLLVRAWHHPGIHYHVDRSHRQAGDLFSGLWNTSCKKLSLITECGKCWDFKILIWSRYNHLKQPLAWGNVINWEKAKMLMTVMMVLLVMVMVMMEMMVAWSASLIASEKVAVAVGNSFGVYQYLQASSKWWWYSWCWRGLKSRCWGRCFLLVLFTRYPGESETLHPVWRSNWSNRETG